MISKTELLHSIQDLPENFTLDVLLEKLLLIEKIQKGQLQVKDGKTYSTEEAKEKLKKWLK
jgi:hypothetical protein